MSSSYHKYILNILMNKWTLADFSYHLTETVIPNRLLLHGPLQTYFTENFCPELVISEFI